MRTGRLPDQQAVHLRAGGQRDYCDGDGGAGAHRAIDGAGRVSVRAGDIETLAAGLRKWHDDRELLRAAREHAWQLGTARYNWDVEKRVFLDLVDTVLEPSGAVAAGSKRERI